MEIVGDVQEHAVCHFILTEENAYAILNEDGTYNIYLYGEYLETVNSLKYYDSSLPIYTRNNSN